MNERIAQLVAELLAELGEDPNEVTSLTIGIDEIIVEHIHHVRTTPR